MREYSLTEAAEKVGRDRGSFRRVAVRIGRGRQVGRAWVFTDADVKAIDAAWLERGCPAFTEGNDLWKQRQRRRKKRN